MAEKQLNLFSLTVSRNRVFRAPMIKEIKVATVRECPAATEKVVFHRVEPRRAGDICAPELCGQLRRMHLVGIYLNTRYYPVSFSLISIGSMNESIAHPREVFRPALIIRLLRHDRFAQSPERRPNPEPGRSFAHPPHG